MEGLQSSGLLEGARDGSLELDGEVGSHDDGWMDRWMSRDKLEPAGFQPFWDGIFLSIKKEGGERERGNRDNWGKHWTSPRPNFIESGNPKRATWMRQSVCGRQGMAMQLPSMAIHRPVCQRPRGTL